MKSRIKLHRTTGVISIILLCILSLSRCISESNNTAKRTNEDDFKKFAGSQSCANCHKDIYEKHLHTEHHLTSTLPTDKSILGSFEEGKNAFAFDGLNLIKMEKRDSGFYQVHYSNGNEIRKARFDIVVGSGRKGQSYLNWLDERLVQLPITYFSPVGQWSNSPGYPPDKIVFNRPITSRCLECHSTYFEKLSDTSVMLEEFDHNRLILGVECEKCHGPGAMHVEFQSKNPGVREAKYIINPRELPRERILDLCALCHGGKLTKTKPSFSFQAGDTLSNYFSPQSPFVNANNIDVHGNQLGLLSFSKCFKLSNLTCMNCHNIHENENGQIKVFSQRCMNCHSEGHGKICKMTASIGPAITQNCIDCHMPKQPSHAVTVFLQGEMVPTPVMMRTHYVKVYPEEVKKVLEKLKQQKPPLKQQLN
jgi:hypothetical protein